MACGTLLRERRADGGDLTMEVIIKVRKTSPEYTSMKMGELEACVREAVNKGLIETGYGRYLYIEDVVL